MNQAEKIAQILSVESTQIAIENNETVYLDGEKIGKITSTEKFRLQIILTEDGEWQDLLNAVSQQSQRVQIAFENATTINRWSHACELIRQVLGKSHEEVNDIFERANAIEI